LREMRLSPSIYWEKFNSLSRESSETFQQFATRLMSLFDLYLESRKIDKNYEKLFDLIIYDRIKSVLPPFLSRHVLALESATENRWIGRHALVDALHGVYTRRSSRRSHRVNKHATATERATVHVHATAVSPRIARIKHV